VAGGIFSDVWKMILPAMILPLNYVAGSGEGDRPRAQRRIISAGNNEVVQIIYGQNNWKRENQSPQKSRTQKFQTLEERETVDSKIHRPLLSMIAALLPDIRRASFDRVSGLPKSDPHRAGRGR